MVMNRRKTEARETVAYLSVYMDFPTEDIYMIPGGVLRVWELDSKESGDGTRQQKQQQTMLPKGHLTIFYVYIIYHAIM